MSSTIPGGRRHAGARRRAACAAALLAAGGVVAQPSGVPPGPELEWRSDRKLEWRDFRAPVDPAAPPHIAATTTASLRASYGYVIERRSGLCGYRITEISAAAVFHPEASWVRPEARIAAVLAHEQGHFDLTEVHRLELEAEARALLDVRHTCRHAGAVEEEVVRRVEPLREAVWSRLAAVQDQYDRETGNGSIDGKQREWSERIAAALRRGRWE